MSPFLGIAGYMGAGKTTVARIFSESGVTVIDADREAKRLMDNDTEIKRMLKKSFGELVFDNDVISYKNLGSLVFSSIEELQMLNGIVHPRLIRHLDFLLHEDCSEKKVLDAALIPLWKIDDWFDIKIWVHASFETRLKRVMRKAAIDEKEVRRRMMLQERLFSPPDNGSWIYIENEGDFEQIKTNTASRKELLRFWTAR